MSYIEIDGWEQNCTCSITYIHVVLDEADTDILINELEEVDSDGCVELALDITFRRLLAVPLLHTQYTEIVSTCRLALFPGSPLASLLMLDL